MESQDQLDRGILEDLTLVAYAWHVRVTPRKRHGEAVIRRVEGDELAAPALDGFHLTMDMGVIDPDDGEAKTGRGATRFAHLVCAWQRRGRGHSRSSQQEFAAAHVGHRGSRVRSVSTRACEDVLVRR